jgi:hypothetical protein
LTSLGAPHLIGIIRLLLSDAAVSRSVAIAALTGVMAGARMYLLAALG